jgi:hypothetical protein
MLTRICVESTTYRAIRIMPGQSTTNSVDPVPTLLVFVVGFDDGFRDRVSDHRFNHFILVTLR